MALITVRAAAAELGIAYSTLKRWIRTGVVRTTRTEGGHHRVSDTEIERLLARSQPEARRRASRAEADESLGGLSARNRLHGFIDEVRVDGLLAQVRIRVGNQDAHDPPSVIGGAHRHPGELFRGRHASRDPQHGCTGPHSVRYPRITLINHGYQHRQCDTGVIASVVFVPDRYLQVA